MVVVVDFVAEVEECAAVAAAAFVGGRETTALTRQGKKRLGMSGDGSAAAVLLL